MHEINDGNVAEFLAHVEASGYGRGLIPRNYREHPPGYLAGVPEFSDALIIPENEWAERLADQQAHKISLYDLREANYDTLKSLDQNGYGLCWAFSTTKAAMYARALQNEPPVILSAWWVAGRVKNWRDEGGWGAASLDQIVREGVPAMALCPEYNRRYDSDEVRSDAAKHKVTEWWDGSDNRDKNRAIMVTAFLLGLPPVLDYDDISHSMCGCRLVSLDPLTVDCDNSWGEGENRGLYRKRGRSAIPDGVVVPRAEMAG